MREPRSSSVPRQATVRPTRRRGQRHSRPLLVLWAMRGHGPRYLRRRAARGGRLRPEILRNTRRQRFPHSLLFRGLGGPDVHHATSPWHGGSPRFVDLGHNLWRSPFESACLKGTCDAAQLARLCHLREALEYDDVVRFHGPTIGQLHSWIPSHLMGTMDSTSLDAMFATG